MALENITSGAAHTIADLDPNNPGGGDQVSQGDDHIRNIKKAIQLTWPNLSDTCSGVASEFAFAHKGGTVSGSAVIKGDVKIDGTASISGDLGVGGNSFLSGNVAVRGSLSVSELVIAKHSLNVLGSSTSSGSAFFGCKQVNITGRLSVSATISGSIAEAAFARSASYAISALHAISADQAGFAASTSYAISALRAVSASNAGFAVSASQAIQNHGMHQFSAWITASIGGASVKFQSDDMTWSRRGAGRYTISHNLGSSSVALQVTTDNETNHGWISDNISNAVLYYTESAGTAKDIIHMVTIYVKV